MEFHGLGIYNELAFTKALSKQEEPIGFLGLGMLKKKKKMFLTEEV